MTDSNQTPGSMLLVEECFERGDANFVNELRRIGKDKRLGPFAVKWAEDPRSWAREQIFEYLARPFDVNGHQVVVKRLFKAIEKRGDVELMGAFVVAFDRAVRRVRRKSYAWNRDSRTMAQVEQLHTPYNAFSTPFPKPITRTNPFTNKVYTYVPEDRRPRSGRLFNYRTRYYLRRRAWRFFRWLRYSHPTAYVPAVASFLARYRDEDLQVGENVLDSRSLMLACFRRHPALEFSATHIRVVAGRSLSELNAAPMFSELWQEAAAFEPLLNLAINAPSRLVRVWAIELLRRDHREHSQSLPLSRFMEWLDHPAEDIQNLAAEWFCASNELPTLPLDLWLKLLEVRNPTALAMICEAMAKHVVGDRLTLSQCVALSAAAPTPVARLGLSFLKARRITTADDRRAIAALAGTKCESLATEIAQWALRHLSGENYDLELITPFFDSLSILVRATAWQWMVGTDDVPGEARAYDDPQLWARLLESPFDDIRLRLIDELQQRERLPGTSQDRLAPVWCSVLLGVHRGGRQKQKATEQIARAIVEQPQRAESLLPVLVVAIRSMRATERRSGLAALMKVVAAQPQLAATANSLLPELTL